MREISVMTKVEGLYELRRALRKQAEFFTDEMAKLLPAEAEELLRVANASAPVGSGKLKASAEVSSSIQPSRGRVRVAAAYLDIKAAAVHEGIHFKRRIKGTRGFKWYEHAFNEFEAGFLERIADHLRQMTAAPPK